MQSAFRIVVSLVLLSSALASYQNNAKLRRDGALNLYPFPRVGRSGPRTKFGPLWHIPLNELLLDESIDKRLVSFPRVGRDAALLSAARRSDQSGMWFGPRVGRSEFNGHGTKNEDRLKNDDEDASIQNDLNGSEPEQIEPTHEE